MPTRRAAADRRGRTVRGPPDRRGPGRGAVGDDDLRILGFDEWLEGLEAGIATTHAGMVPAFRETVKGGLLRRRASPGGLATETLSLGINMPARTVVIERFTKFGGSGRAPLTSGEYAPDDRAGGPAGPRRRGPHGGRLVGRDGHRRDGPGGRGAAPGPALGLPADLQPRRQPGAAVQTEERAAVELLQRSFAQWQAEGRGSGGDGDPLGPGARRVTDREGHDLGGRPAGPPAGRAQGARLRRRVAPDHARPPARPDLPRRRPAGRRSGGF